MVGSIGVIAINPVLYKDPGYHPLQNFDLLSVAVRNPNVLITRPDFPGFASVINSPMIDGTICQESPN